MEGKKNDQDKPMMALLPQEALIEVAKVLTFGAERYGSWNWAKGLKYSRLLSAVYRHLAEVQQKTDIDPETGLQHTAHAICGLLFLLTYQLRGLGEDDRYDRYVPQR
ncbi:MAG: hypothetical protein IPL32_19355 [Chloracidobacterium sp.]|nr:hypothetical protein [Chloracidobacterium sp.]